MLNTLKIWWLNRRLQYLTLELAGARYDYRRIIATLDMEMLALENKKRGTILRLIDLQAEADRAASMPGQAWPR